MPEPTRPARARDQMTITKGHLFALGALSVFMATLAFFVGLKLGRGTPPVEVKPQVVALLDEEARSGNLEALLMRVEATQAPAQLVFPEALPHSDPQPAPAVEGVEPEPAPPPEPVVVPDPAAEGSASLPPAAVAPAASDQVPTQGWAVEIASRATVEEAAVLVESLRAAGLSAYHVEARVDGRPEHRVRIGGYHSEAAAKEAVPELRGRAGTTTATVLAVP